MELLIRSQDKKNLVKIINQIGLHYSNNNMIIANYKPDFIGTQGEYYEMLGTYKTRERALEVLDEIQYFRDHLNILELKPRAYYNENKYDTVYEMPKE